MVPRIARIATAVCFALPTGLLAWQDYGPFVWAHLFALRRPAASPAPVPAPRPRPAWATPVNAPPLTNVYRVTQDLYRGAQPGAAGMRRLKAMGVRTVVNLRRLHSDADEAAGTGLDIVHVRVNPFHPTEAQVVAFLRVVADPGRGPFYVHCQRGIDRTGMMCAAYRMVACGWAKADAVDEMTNGPFGYDHVFRNVPQFLRRLDVERLRAEVMRGARPATRPRPGP